MTCEICGMRDGFGGHVFMGEYTTESLCRDCLRFRLEESLLHKKDALERKHLPRKNKWTTEQAVDAAWEKMNG